jgi:hypothetical protein
MGLLDSYVSSGIGVAFVCDPAGWSTELLIASISRASNGPADGYGGSDIDKALEPAIASTSVMVFVSKAYIPLHDYEETPCWGNSLCL